jgi:hypothetical protein
MASKPSHVFSAPELYNNWGDYFAAYRESRRAFDDPAKEVERGTIEMLSGVVPQKFMAEVKVPKGATDLQHLATELGFDSEVLVHRERKFWNGDWTVRDVVHVTGLKRTPVHSAFHARWVAGKPETGGCKVQVNGGMPEWVGVTELRKKILEAK